MKIFQLREICPNEEFAQKVIYRYKDVSYIEMPDWFYINEFETSEWADWWENISKKYNLIVGENFRIEID